MKYHLILESDSIIATDEFKDLAESLFCNVDLAAHYFPKISPFTVIHALTLDGVKEEFWNVPGVEPSIFRKERMFEAMHKIENTYKNDLLAYHGRVITDTFKSVDDTFGELEDIFKMD